MCGETTPPGVVQGRLATALLRMPSHGAYAISERSNVMSLFKQILLAKQILKRVLQECPLTMTQVCEGIDAPEGQVERMVGLLADYGLLKRFNRSGNTWILLTNSGLHTYRRVFARIALRAELT